MNYFHFLFLNLILICQINSKKLNSLLPSGLFPRNDVRGQTQKLAIDLKDHVRDVDISLAEAYQRSLEAQLVEKYAKIVQLQVNLDNLLISRLNIHTSTLGVIKVNNEFLTQQLNHRAFELNDLETRSNDLQLAINEHRNTLTKEETDHVTLDIHIHREISKLVQSTVDLNSLKTPLKEFQSQVFLLTSHQNYFKNDLDDKWRALIGLEAILRNLDHKFGKKSIDLTQLKVIQNGLVFEMKEKSQIVSNLATRQNILVTRLNDKIVELVHLHKKFGGVEVSLLFKAGQLSRLHLEENKFGNEVRVERGRVGVLQENSVRFKLEMDGKWEELVQARQIQGSHVTQQNSTNHRLHDNFVRTRNLEVNVLHLQQNPVPEGFVYLQLAGKEDPRLLWPNILWVDVTPNYAGLFFRAEGGGSAFFGEVQEQSSPHIVEAQYGWEVKTGGVAGGVKFACGGWSGRINVGVGGHSNPMTLSDTLRFRTENCKIHPRNQAIKIWKRDSLNISALALTQFL